MSLQFTRGSSPFKTAGPAGQRIRVVRVHTRNHTTNPHSRTKLTIPVFQFQGEMTPQTRQNPSVCSRKSPEQVSTIWSLCGSVNTTPFYVIPVILHGVFFLLRSSCTGLCFQSEGWWHLSSNTQRARRLKRATRGMEGRTYTDDLIHEHISSYTNEHPHIRSNILIYDRISVHRT